MRQLGMFSDTKKNIVLYDCHNFMKKYTQNVSYDESDLLGHRFTNRKLNSMIRIRILHSYDSQGPCTL